jgi:hypothetical protein
MPLKDTIGTPGQIVVEDRNVYMYMDDEWKLLTVIQSETVAMPYSRDAI